MGQATAAEVRRSARVAERLHRQIANDVATAAGCRLVELLVAPGPGDRPRTAAVGGPRLPLAARVAAEEVLRTLPVPAGALHRAPGAAPRQRPCDARLAAALESPPG